MVPMWCRKCLSVLIVFAFIQKRQCFLYMAVSYCCKHGKELSGLQWPSSSREWMLILRMRNNMTLVMRYGYCQPRTSIVIRSGSANGNDALQSLPGRFTYRYYVT